MTDRLFSLQDKAYQAFQQKLIPNIPSGSVIGVRTPDLRRLAKEMEDAESFKGKLPHRYFEENQLHALLLNREKDFFLAVMEVDAFLPYVDNWATCDQLRPRVFARHRQELLPHIRRWMASERAYTVRFGIEMLMVHHLDDTFHPDYPEWVSRVVHEDYYVRMMVAWYFATALAKQYEAVLPYITQYRLPKWIHNKAIQKAVESYRIGGEQKDMLKKCRIK